MSDNKGPIMAVACAAAALRQRRELDVDLVMLVEGEEEAGSRGFASTVRKHKVSRNAPVNTTPLHPRYMGVKVMNRIQSGISTQCCCPTLPGSTRMIHVWCSVCEVSSMPIWQFRARATTRIQVWTEGQSLNRCLIWSKCWMPLRIDNKSNFQAFVSSFH